MTKRQKQWLVRILVGGFLGVAVLFLIGAALGSSFIYGSSSFRGLVLVDGVMVLRLGGQEGLAVAVQILLFFLLGAATGVATLPFADDGAALLRRTLAHFAVTAVLVALLAGLNFGRYGILVWLLLLVVLYLLIWCSRWIGWYLEVAAIRHKLGLAPGPSPFQWRETLPYLGFALLLCLGLPALLRVLEEQTQRLSDLVGDLLALSNMDTLECGDRVDVPQLLADTVEDLLEQARQQQVSIQLHTQPGTVLGNRTLLERALFNLVENAVKYNRSDGTVTVSAACAGGVLRVEITDQGIGIPQELLQQVFEPFFRVDPSRSRQLGGAGLGLSLVRAIAELHNGQVWAEPAPGGGSRFILLLPESEAPPA